MFGMMSSFDVHTDFADLLLGIISVLCDMSLLKIHCLKKNIPDVFRNNSRKHCRIFIIFGRNITKKARNQKMLYFPTSPN